MLGSRKRNDNTHATRGPAASYSVISASRQSARAPRVELLALRFTAAKRRPPSEGRVGRRMRGCSVVKLRRWPVAGIRTTDVIVQTQKNGPATLRARPDVFQDARCSSSGQISCLRGHRCKPLLDSQLRDAHSCSSTRTKRAACLTDRWNHNPRRERGATRFVQCPSENSTACALACEAARLSIRNSLRSLPAIQAGARPRPLHVEPLTGSRYFAASSFA